MPSSENKPPRIQIEDVWPQVDCGRYPVKRSVGDAVEVWATIFRDGHEVLGAAVLYRAPGSSDWQEAPMRFEGNDRFVGSFHVTELGRWEFGCDLCQSVCPWNRKAPVTRESAFMPATVYPGAQSVLAMSDGEFREEFSGTALLRPKAEGMRRNAAIALSNARRAPDTARG